MDFRPTDDQALLRRSLDFMQRFITTLNSNDTKQFHASNIISVDTTPPVLDAIA